MGQDMTRISRRRCGDVSSRTAAKWKDVRGCGAAIIVEVSDQSILSFLCRGIHHYLPLIGLVRRRNKVHTVLRSKFSDFSMWVEREPDTDANTWGPMDPEGWTRRHLTFKLRLRVIVASTNDCLCLFTSAPRVFYLSSILSHGRRYRVYSHSAPILPISNALQTPFDTLPGSFVSRYETFLSRVILCSGRRDWLCKGRLLRGIPIITTLSTLNVPNPRRSIAKWGAFSFLRDVELVQVHLPAR